MCIRDRVTGGGAGIGKVCSRALLKAGFLVVVCGRHQETLDSTIAESDDPDSMLGVACDVSSEQQVDNLFKSIMDKFGRIDVVFNNAGNNVPPMTIDELSVDQWRTVIDVNLHGAFLIARAAFREMRGQSPQGGRIINNGSISAHAPRPGSVPYTTSKHAITGLTRTISLDGRPFNIACGQIDIGNAASAMTEKMNSGVPQADGSMKAEPTVDPQHIADAVVHMSALPLDVNVQFMTIMATTMPYIGRG